MDEKEDSIDELTDLTISLLELKAVAVLGIQLNPDTKIFHERRAEINNLLQITDVWHKYPPRTDWEKIEYANEIRELRGRILMLKFYPLFRPVGKMQKIIFYEKIFN